MPSPQASVRPSRSSVRPEAAGRSGGGGRRRHGVRRRRDGVRCRRRGVRGRGGRSGRDRLLAPPHRAEGGASRHLRRWARCRRWLRLRIGGRRGGRRGPGTAGRGTRSGEGGRAGLGALEDADPLRQRLHARIEVRAHGADGCDLEDDLRVGRLAHVDQRVAQDLHAAHHARQPHRFGDATEPLERRSRHRAQLGRQGGEEDLTQVVDQLGPQLLGAPASGQQCAQRDQHLADIAVGQRVDHRGELRSGGVGRARGDDLVQRGEGVAGGAPASAHRRFRAPPRRPGAPPPR